MLLVIVLLPSLGLAQERPNIILFLVDDMGLMDTSVPMLTDENGKAHFGPDQHEGADPRNFGFDVNVGGSAIGHPRSYYGQTNYGKGGRQAVPHLEKYHGTNTFLTECSGNWSPWMRSIR